MRENMGVYRGKAKINGEWVVGCYECCYTQENRLAHGIITVNHAQMSVDWHEVFPETIGQYTGLPDKNGKKIFEGDVMRFTNPEGDSSIYVIQWMQRSCVCGWVARFMPLPDDDGDPLDDFFCSMSEIIGNIHDHPELLEVSEG